MCFYLFFFWSDAPGRGKEGEEAAQGPWPTKQLRISMLEKYFMQYYVVKRTTHACDPIKLNE